MDTKQIKRNFPILKHKINGKRLVYLDSAVTSQKPKQVIAAEKEFYETTNANLGRAVYMLGEQATKAHEDARKKVADFIGAAPEEIIFVRNTTEAINLVASCISQNLKAGDEILVTIMEHHSNIVPWQIAAEKTGAKINFVNVLPDGTLDLAYFQKLLSGKTKIVAVTYVSNVLGTINPIKEIVAAAKTFGASVLVDAAQAAPHMPINVKELGCDFLAFSGHKMLGPTGIGVLYGRKEVLEQLPPFMAGGGMIREVTQEKASYLGLPHRFEAGTQNIAGAIALGAAIDYLKNLGMEKVREHEKGLTKYALEKLPKVKGLEIYGPKDVELRSGVISFNLKGAHPHDVAQILDSEGIAIRSGHDCAMPLMQKLGVPAVCRASFYVYNDKKDVNALVKGLKRVKEVLKL